MAPRVPNVGVSVAGRDSARAEIIEVTVPHGLRRPRERDIQARRERGDEEEHPKGAVRTPHSFSPSVAAPRIRRMYVFCTWAGSSLRYFASSFTKPRT